MSAPREGGCSCGAVRYRLASEPMFVHCWVTLPGSAPAFDVYYDSKKLWPPESLERLDAVLARA